MTKNEMQHIFLGNLARLIRWMQEHYTGCWVVGGDLWRDRSLQRSEGVRRHPTSSGLPSTSP